MTEQIDQLQKQTKTIAEEKQSLEELNSSWSKKIQEQNDEIESTKNKMTNMETLMEETTQKLAGKSSEVETLEETLRTEVGINSF